ncbi:winged helix-turn-helix transcriptional regulator [Micromonospora sp. NPDC048898]|uniref:winged helix-turn-helix transcriptional regulator n=1 Tax=Micromonospora sp. NPDC048898 TaxID=3364260 RepID=UPI00371F4B42
MRRTPPASTAAGGVGLRAPAPGAPARVDYQLTPLGESLPPVQRAIKAWAETHIGAVHAGRARYDAPEN